MEDGGEGVCFHVYCYNNQPGIAIDYATGESWLDGEEPQSSGTASSGGETAAETEQHYVLNTNSKKFHLPGCSGVENMNPSNRQDYTGTRQSLLDQGYSPNRLPLHFHRKFTGLFLVFKGIVCYSIKDLDPPAETRRHRDFPVPGSMESLFCRFDGGILP